MARGSREPQRKRPEIRLQSAPLCSARPERRPRTNLPEVPIDRHLTEESRYALFCGTVYAARHSATPVTTDSLAASCKVNHVVRRSERAPSAASPSTSGSYALMRLAISSSRPPG